MHPWTLVRECAAALVSGGSLGVVVAPDPGEVDFADLVPLDAYKYPMLRLPAACATDVLRLTAHVVSLADAGLEVTVTGTARAAARRASTTTSRHTSWGGA